MNNYNYIDPRAELIDQLNDNEKLLWADKPLSGIKFRASDVFVIPFSIVWCGFAIFWTLMAMSSNFYFGLFGIPFVIIGIMLLIGRFFLDAAMRKNTVYGLTNMRLIQKSGIITKNYKTLYLSKIPSVSYTEKSDGSGNVNFGFSLGNFKSQGIENKQDFPINRIEFIPNVRVVHNKINDAKERLEWERRNDKR